MSSTIAATRVDQFRAAVGHLLEADQIRIDGLSDLSVDGVSPELAVQPGSLEQLQAVLSEAHEARLALTPVGGGTHLGLGNVPEAYDAALSLRRLARVVAYEPADLTVTVEPGVRLVDLERLLEAQGQFLPLDPACGDGATIGGVLAANAHGPLRHAYGTARDWLIGIRVVHADGSVSKSGGRVVKNVTGYDMHKLYVGSLGTLGVIAEATLKVAPRPATESTVAIACRSAAQASELILAAHDAGLALHAAELLSPPASHAVLGPSSWSAVLRVAGAASAVERSLREIDAAASATGVMVDACATQATWKAWGDAFGPTGLSLRISVMPSVVGEVAQVLDRRFTGAGARISATVSAGLIRATLEPSRDVRAGALVEAAREIASRYEGGVVVDAASPVLKREIDVFGPARSDIAIMKRLKDEFDPLRLLSPGRFAGRL
jgi:glycolate oxidase FAD binding subunit